MPIAINNIGMVINVKIALANNRSSTRFNMVDAPCMGFSYMLMVCSSPTWLTDALMMLCIKASGTNSTLAVVSPSLYKISVSRSWAMLGRPI